MMEKFKDLAEDVDTDVPCFAWISLARRGMEKISLDQCFLPECDNEDPALLEKISVEEKDDEKKHVKIITRKCKKCNGIYKLKLETLKRVAHPVNSNVDDEEALSMGLVYVLDENDKNLGHLGYF